VWNIFICFSKYFLVDILLLLLFLRGVMRHHFGFKFILFSYTFFRLDDPSLLSQEYKKRNLLGTLEYFFVDGWHVLLNSQCGS
jgi:hypothetical protein